MAGARQLRRKLVNEEIKEGPDLCCAGNDW